MTEVEIPLADPDLVDGLKMTAEPVRLWALAALGDLPGARERAEAIVAAADRHDDPALMAAETILSLGAWDEGRLAAGLDLMRDAVHRASRGFGTSSHSELGRSHLSLRLAKMLADVGRFNEAYAVVRSAEEIEPSRRSVQAATSAVLRAQIELAAGRLDAAATAAGLATPDQLGPHPLAPGALCVLATVALRRGDLGAPPQHVKSYRALLAANPVTFGSAHCAWVEAQLADAQDGPVGAFEVMTVVYDCLPARRGLLVGDPALAAWMVRTALAVGDRKRAEGVVAGAEQLAAANPEFPTIAAAAEHARGLLHGNAAALVQAAGQHRHLWAGPPPPKTPASCSLPGAMATAPSPPSIRPWLRVPAGGGRPRCRPGSEQIAPARRATQPLAPRRTPGVRLGQPHRYRTPRGQSCRRGPDEPQGR